MVEVGLDDVAFDSLYSRIRCHFGELDLEPRKTMIRGLVQWLEAKEEGAHTSIPEKELMENVNSYLSGITDSDTRAQRLRELIETLTVEEYYMHLSEKEKEALAILIDDDRVRGQVEEAKTEGERSLLLRRFTLGLHGQLQRLKMLHTS